MITPEEVHKIIKNALIDSTINIDNDTTWESLKLDSLDVMEIIMALEDTFHIDIFDDELTGTLLTVGDLVSFVQGKTQ